MVEGFFALTSDVSGRGKTSVVDIIFGNEDSRNGRVTWTDVSSVTGAVPEGATF